MKHAARVDFHRGYSCWGAAWVSKPGTRAFAAFDSLDQACSSTFFIIVRSIDCKWEADEGRGSIYEQSLALDPNQPDVREVVEKLETERGSK
jgi:hypothetical protein